MAERKGRQTTDSQTLFKAIQDADPNGSEQESYEEMERYPEEMLLAENIRPFDDDHIERLGISIFFNKQLYPSIAHTLPDGNVQVIAGQHRYMAVARINEYIRQDAATNGVQRHELRKLRVMVSPRTLSTDEILNTQLTENLQHPMEPHEKAQVIVQLYNLYLQTDNKEQKSISSFARRIGRGLGEVRAAIRYSQLDVLVQELVQEGALLYSIAVQEIGRLPIDKQFDAARRIIEGNMPPNKIRTLIEELIGNNQVTIGLFGPEEMARIQQEERRIHFRQNAAVAAREAAGYLHRILVLTKKLNNGQQIEITEAVQDILVTYVICAQGFLSLMEQLAPELAEQIKQRLPLDSVEQMPRQKSLFE